MGMTSSSTWVSRAVDDFSNLDLCNLDSRTLWMRAIRAQQALGRLYAQKGDLQKAISAFERSLDLLAAVKHRQRESAQFKAYSALSNESLARLLAQRSTE